MSCRGFEGKLTMAVEHMGPGLGVSRNKALLAHLPAHWHTARHPRVSRARTDARSNIFHTHSQSVAPSINAHDTQTHRYQPPGCNCAPWSVLILWILHYKFKLIWSWMEMSEQRTSSHERNFSSSPINWQMQCSSSAIFFNALIWPTTTDLDTRQFSINIICICNDNIVLTSEREPKRIYVF